MFIVKDVDVLFNRLVEKGESHPDFIDERIPYWADLWPSSIVLSEFILDNYSDMSGMRVLEIGCGLGLPGIVAGSIGADLTFSDYEQAALEVAENNWYLNNSRSAKFLHVDWRVPPEHLKFDLILASDVAYERKSYQNLIQTFKVLLKPEAKILLAEPNRAMARDFPEALVNAGFELNSNTFDYHFGNMNYKIFIHKIC
ncbi:MAG: methyltransferase domain-containing protein [Bacteroidetes bacterium]|nr:MAG: methyltransferase domain-containing protein [Bacteroidota bacterium]REK03362.1 MAG: methyltransferase domain-containing protein [Bacteroidota bacterium]REK34527.1 MAG: methyltransferase domain-containing protein [Bacteroidota bacterium]REK50355.1 MAG: methyltransferase domain-containing protein [Bacteroidota bacterium]